MTAQERPPFNRPMAVLLGLAGAGLGVGLSFVMRYVGSS